MIKVKLTNGMTAIVDEDDAHLAHYSWSALEAPHTTYAHRRDGDRVVYMHRVVLKYDGPHDIDHVNNNGLDSRKCNLRIMSRSHNLLNRAAQSTQGVRPVERSDGVIVYDARIRFQYTEYSLGRYRTRARAQLVVDANRKRLLEKKSIIAFKRSHRAAALRRVEYEVSHD